MTDIDIPGEEAYHGQKTYSVEAEDLMVHRLLMGLFDKAHDYVGFYVDLGAFDPIRASNTYRFYQRGWRGVNIEANPAAIERFQIVRPRDLNLNIAIGADEQVGEYLEFAEPLLNGFLPPDVVHFHSTQGREVIGRRPVPFRSINSVLSEYVPNGTAIDFLNIDIETMEHAVLSEWDFGRWRPLVIAAEIFTGRDVAGIAASPVARLLHQQDYVFTSRLWQTSIFTSA